MNVDYDQLELAMAADPAFTGRGFYLDTATGEVIGADDWSIDRAREYDHFRAIPADKSSIRLAWYLLWDNGTIDADLSEQDAETLFAFFDRLIPVPHFESGEEYDDMETFARQVDDADVAEQLQNALGGRGSSRRFKDTLLRFPTLRQEWFNFQAQRRRQRMDDWLRSEGLLDDDENG